METAYTAYDKFDGFKCSPDVSIADFTVEFERLYNKAKNYEMFLPDSILAYKFLTNASLSENNLQLVKATFSELTYEKVKEQMRKIFGDLKIPIPSENEPHIRLKRETEDVLKLKYCGTCTLWISAKKQVCRNI